MGRNYIINCPRCNHGFAVDRSSRAETCYNCNRVFNPRQRWHEVHT